MKRKKTKKLTIKEVILWIVSEGSFFAALYYLLYFLRPEIKPGFTSFILWGLINVSILTCPVLKKYCK